MLLLFVTEFLLLAKWIEGNPKNPRAYGFAEKKGGPSPLTFVDPPDLQFLHNNSYTITFTGGIHYRNISYLLNWSNDMLFANNRRYWLAFHESETSTSQIFLKDHLATCVYDVTENLQFSLLHKTMPDEDFYTNYAIIQCPLGECRLDDFGCGKSPFPWWRLVFVIVSLFLIMLIMYLKKNFTLVIPGKYQKQPVLVQKEPLVKETI